MPRWSRQSGVAVVTTVGPQSDRQARGDRGASLGAKTNLPFGVIASARIRECHWEQAESREGEA